MLINRKLARIIVSKPELAINLPDGRQIIYILSLIQ